MSPRRYLSTLVVTLFALGCELDTVGHAYPRSRSQTDTTVSPSNTGSAPPAVPTVSSLHLALGMPVDTSPQDELLLVKQQYVVSYNRFRNAPNWVAWHLTLSDLGDVGRTRQRFSPDPQLPRGVYRVVHRDYAGSGYDHGHLCPSAQRTASAEDNAATFLTTNIVPQRHGVNAGAWEDLERWCTDRVREGWDLFIVAGASWPRECATDSSPAGNPVSDTCPSIGRSPDPARRVAIPTSTWKVVVMVPHGGSLGAVNSQTLMLAADMPNVSGGLHEWRRYIISVDTLEARTGYDFNTLVPQSVQTVTESRVYSAR